MGVDVRPPKSITLGGSFPDHSKMHNCFGSMFLHPDQHGLFCLYLIVDVSIGFEWRASARPAEQLAEHHDSLWACPTAAPYPIALDDPELLDRFLGRNDSLLQLQASMSAFKGIAGSVAPLCRSVRAPSEEVCVWWVAGFDRKHRE